MKKIKLIASTLLAGTCLTPFTLVSCTNGQQKQHFLIEFDSNGGTYVRPQDIISGEKVTKPNDPTKHIGSFVYTFDGWYDGETKFDFENTQVTSNIILKAKWLGTPPPPVKYYYVDFNSDGGTSIPSQQIQENNHAIPPTTPTKVIDGFAYTFDGWYDGETKFNFQSTLINENKILKAKWIGTPPPKTYTLTFTGTNCMMNGRNTFSETLIRGATITRSICPNKWFDIPDPNNVEITGSGAQAVTYSNGILSITNLLGDVVIAATSTATKVAITFDAQGGTLDKSGTIKINPNTKFGNISDKPIATPKEPNYYTFVGWGLNKTDTIEIPDTTLITSDTTVYAIYKPINSSILCFSKDSSNCTLYLNDKKVEPGIPIEVLAEKEMKLKIESNSGYLPILSGKIDIIGAQSSSFNAITKTINIVPLKDKICTIIANAEKPGDRSLNDFSWSEINEISQLKLANTAFKLGDTKNVIINTKTHRVRLIGFDHDKLETPTASNFYASMSFEFADLISDSNGFSLATPWDWRADGGSFNAKDYLNSNIRKAIDGQGNGTISWYQSAQPTKSTTYTSSVLKMIPEDLRNILKSVEKKVVTGNDLEVTTFTTKLFPLSYKEVTQTQDRHFSDYEGSTYEYYKQAPDSSRIKLQINGNEGAVTSPCTITDSYEGTPSPQNWAGFNDPGENCGCIFFTRSPSILPEAGKNYVDVCCVDPGGKLIYPICDCFRMVVPVAPGFCI